MPTFSTTRNYQDGTTLTQSQLDAAFTSIETFINTTKLDGTNLQASSITASQLAANAVTSAAIAAASVAFAALASDVTSKLVPTGAVEAYAGATSPTGWLLCDGTAVSRTTYAALYNTIGVTHGYGLNDGLTFSLPDYRGRFLRGVDGAAARDPDKLTRTAMNPGGNTGNTVGAVQGGATKLPNTSFTSDSQGIHAHTVGFNNNGMQPNTAGSGVFVPQVGFNISTSSDGAHTHTVNGGGDNETRPQNAYVNFIIKT